MPIPDFLSAILGQGIDQSVLFGIIVASAFPIGAAAALTRKFPREAKGNLAAIAAGIYFSTLAFSLVDEAIRVGSFPTMAAGFIVGAASFSIAHPIVNKRKELRQILSPSSYVKEQKEVDGNSTGDTNSESINKKRRTKNNNDSSSGEMNIVGTILDSVPENLFIGSIIALNLAGLSAVLPALFLGNLTATMDGAQRMFDKGMQRSKIFKRWMVDFLIVAPSGLIGWYLVKPLGGEGIGAIIGFAAGALLVFVTVDLIPKAFSEIKWHIGLSTTMGLIVVLAIFHYLA